MKLTYNQEKALMDLKYLFSSDIDVSSYDKEAREIEYSNKGITFQTLRGLEKRYIIESISIYHLGWVDVKKGKNWNKAIKSIK